MRGEKFKSSPKMEMINVAWRQLSWSWRFPRGKRERFNDQEYFAQSCFVNTFCFDDENVNFTERQTQDFQMRRIDLNPRESTEATLPDFTSIKSE